ncbi:MAG: hypothetical protein M3171_11165 [Actinomycetota bacterium]|nr:hypothetical protein [Actinomycetota bacterium]
MANTQEGGGHVLEGFSVVAALAAVVSRVRFGTLVAGNLYRHTRLSSPTRRRRSTTAVAASSSASGRGGRQLGPSEAGGHEP